jgi:hypothetical protein
MMLFTTGGDQGKTEDSSFIPSTINEPIDYAKKDIAAAFKDALDLQKFQQFFIGLEDQATKTAKSISNGIVANQELIGKTIFNVYKDNIKLGAGLKDVNDYILEYGEQLGRIPQIQEETIKNAIIFSKATGLSTKEVAQFVGAMEKIGIGQTKSLEKLNKIYITGRRYGVDAAKLTQDVVKNISKASIYGFKDGVDGLTKMAARAQQIGISMEHAMKFAQDVLDPDTAIETAASMQMLGGAVGALGDPFQLLYMAQNDVGGLQEEMVKATESAVDFNETTGEFKIPVSEMYRLKEMAGKLGMSYEDISENAIKAAKQTQVLSMIDLPSTFSEEDKNFVASLSEINGGKVQIQLPGTGEMIDAAGITKENLEALREKAELDGKTTEQLQQDMLAVAKNQLSAQDKSNISLEEIKMGLVFNKGVGGLEKYPDLLEQLSEGASAAGKVIKDSTKTKEAIDALDTAMQTMVTNTVSYLTNATDFQTDLNVLLSNIKNNLQTWSGVTTTPTLPPATIPAGDILIGKNNNDKVIKGGFGEFYKPDVDDEILAMPNISKLMSDANTAFSAIENLENDTTITNQLQTGGFSMTQEFLNFAKKISSSKIQNKETPNISELIGGNIEKLEDLGSTVINQNISSSQRIDGNVGVDGNVNINVNVPNGLLSNALSSDREFQGALKDEIMKVVNYRLSEAYKKGQGNFS